MIWRAALIALVLGNGAHAQEFVHTDTALSDTDFYRLVACAAPPGGDCAKPEVRWSKTKISVGITRMDSIYLGGKKKRADASLQRALQRINSAGSVLQLSRDDKQPDIVVLFIDMPMNAMLQNTGFQQLDGTPIGAAGVRVFSSKGEILKAVIIFTRDLQMRAYESAMLEEVLQGLGFLTDIGGPFYEKRSIFSQSSNSRTKLGEQDIMALGRHYPPR